MLYAKNGPVSIERIYRNEPLIKELLAVLRDLWTRVIAPEVFEMRVPRDLLLFVMPNDFIPDTSQASATQNTVCSREEIEIASFLTTCTSYNYSELQPNLVAIPWGCRTNSGIQLANTCPMDNWLMIFQELSKSGKIDLDELNGAGNNIKTALLMVDLKQYGDAKIISLPTPPVIRNGIIDLW